MGAVPTHPVWQAMLPPFSPDPGRSPAPPVAFRWIKTDCGRAKYGDLAARPGLHARLRLAWFVLIAAIRDWPLPDPDTQRGA